MSNERFQVLEQEISREREISAQVHQDNQLLLNRMAEYEKRVQNYEMRINEVQKLLNAKSESEQRLLSDKAKLEREL